MVENAHFLCVKFDKQGKTHLNLSLFKKEDLHTIMIFCHISEQDEIFVSFFQNVKGQI